MSVTTENESITQDKTDNNLKKDKPKKKYEPIDFYLKDSYVDCKDSVNSWCLARILERCDDDHTLKINFDGWSHRWDEASLFFLSVLEYYVLVGSILLFKDRSF